MDLHSSDIHETEHHSNPMDVDPSNDNEQGYDEEEDQEEEEQYNNNHEERSNASQISSQRPLYDNVYNNSTHNEVIDAAVKLLRLLANLSIDETIGRFISTRIEPFQVWN